MNQNYKLESDIMKEPLLETELDVSLYTKLIQNENITDTQWKFFVMTCLEELMASLKMSKIKIQNLEKHINQISV